MDRVVDFLCVGAGLGGLAGAVRAHALGAEVLVVERSGMVGGVAAYSGGFVWAGATGLAAEAGLEDSLPATEAYLDHVQGEGRPVDRPARRAYLELAIEATRWYREAGVPFQVIRNCPDLYHPAPGSTAEGRLLECAVPGATLGAWRDRLRPSPYYQTGVSRDDLYAERALDAAELERLRRHGADTDLLTHGSGLSAAFVRAALTERGVDCLLHHRVTALVMDGDTVAGAVLDGPDGRTTVRARRGVLLATGGYGCAPDACELEDVPALVESAPPVVEGDNLLLAQRAGAATVRGADPFFSVGFHFPGETHPGGDVPLCRPLLEHLGLPHSMIVNRDGRRFGDESYYGALIGALRRYDGRNKRWANFPCWFLADDEFRRRYRLGPYGPGDPWPDAIARAGSVRELAEVAGIDPDGLAATVAAYNDGAARGEDPEFGRGTLPFIRRAYGDPRHGPNPNLGPLATPPYYALPLSIVGFGMGTLGLWIDGHARVRRRDGSAVTGLYATGNAAATKELRGYVTGLANARNYTYAYAAASHALAVAVEGRR
ncbi:FAD-dependent oxidoreductase [Actinoallomurus sp. NBC_01490]|uniref:FAD-binding protein n=1 Tax=Actinoallomurus sp. NBC_01490 TaxID=2903557 RepID=UPI002E2F18AC|nr:FAD-binding protein [Actinoallomurus sp. NBC_01490]